MGEQADSVPRGGGAPEPGYDPQAVGRVARAIQTSEIVLTRLNFARQGGEPVPDDLDESAVPGELGIAVEGWQLAGDTLGCSLSFRTFFDEDEADEPYFVEATFSVMYEVTAPPPEGLADEDIDVFAHHNAVYNAWPYWRELLTSIMNRAQLPRYIVPVLGVPRAAVTEQGGNGAERG